MIKYANLHGNSGIDAYELGEDHLVVKFKDGGAYLYDDELPGPLHLHQMKAKAVAGRGLNTYISQVIKKNFKRKL